MKEKSPYHDSAHTHVAGLSEYVDDRPMQAGELHVGCVFSQVAHAKILNIDVSVALQIPGVSAVVTADDVVHNAWGPIFQDQPIIAKDHIMFAGEVLAVVGAQTLESLKRGLAAIKVELKRLDPILSIEEAKAKKSFIGSERKIVRGDVSLALKRSPHTISGTLKIQGADHFYLENQSAIAYPKEDGQMEIHSSTQHPTETQHVVAEAIGAKFSDVTCITKRLGGGFGGKESQSSPIAAYAALIAKKTGRPARIVLTKDDDMIMTGKRNPFLIDYHVGFDDHGNILALKSILHSDGGAFADLSTAIMERAMLHSDNAYFIENMEVTGQVCRTNMHPHTAFRGFGGPKGVAVIESIIEDIACHLKMDALEIRKLNVYKGAKNTTHYGQMVDNNKLPQLFNELEERSNYGARRKSISEFNHRVLKSQDSFAAENAWLKGLSMTAVKFGISFTTRFLNQANALVHIHRDGSIQISTGAVEMGQGVHSRIASLVAEELGVSLPRIRIMATSTDKNANTSPTAASTGTDLNGAAALKACRAIKSRLASVAMQIHKTDIDMWPSRTAGLGTMPELEVHSSQDLSSSVLFGDDRVIISGHPDFSISFSDLVNEAYLSRVSLSEHAYHKTENLSFDKIKGQGQAFHYYTQGVAASEIEINRMTGDIKVQRVDILMDAGRPINEALDLGQITGAFIQGMGWVTTENLVYNSEGMLLSHAPSTYKIPNIQDTPRVFNVSLIHNEGNTVNIRSTKALGEPPLLLSLSVWTAVKDAISYASRQNPTTNSFNTAHQLPIPATAEQTLRHLAPELFL